MSRDGKFGTFGGVYTPSVLTILGVIMYLRLPWVVGSAGLYQAIGIILVAHVISISTGLSISSIATDKAVGAGGPYYIVSRSLGLPIGGTLGLALFVGLSFSISLYIIGFSESFLAYFGIERSLSAIRICGTAVIVGLTVLTFISTALAIKTQYLILALIALSLVSIGLGAVDPSVKGPHLQAPADAPPLAALFAIFFPAVTGFTAGVNMSGDLRSPKTAIPKGTLLAIATGFVVYVGLAFFLAYRVPVEGLLGDSELLVNIAWSAPLVVAGIWGATISSALGSILGAPRILQAVSGDGITPRFFAKGFGPTSEPRNALTLAFAIGEAGILIGELDTIARIVSMVFLATYAFLNISCAIESWVSPDFRPDFRIPKAVSVIGAVVSLVVMIQLDLPAMVGATVIMALLYLYLQRRQLKLESGDTWEGFWSSLVRAGLSRLSHGTQQRNWIPNVLCFRGAGSDEAEREQDELLVEALVGATGILTYVEVGGTASASAKGAAAPRTQRKGASGERTVGIFHRDLPAGDDPDAAIVAFSQHYGFVGIQPNTALFDWRDYTERPAELADTLAALYDHDYNELVLARGGAGREQPSRRIDIWWRDQGGNLPLSLSLARFITASPQHERSRLRFILLSDNPNNNDVLRTRARRYLEKARVDAEVKVIGNTLQARSYEDWVRHESADAELILIPLPDEPSAADEHFLTRISRLVQETGDVLLLRASSDFEEVLSVGRPASESMRPAPLGSEEGFSLAELELPSIPSVAQSVAELAASYEVLLGSFDEYCVSRVHSAHLELLRHLREALERQFEQLHKGLLDKNLRRRRQNLNRLQSSYVAEARELLERHVAEVIPQQRATLEGRIEAFLFDESLVPANRNERLKISPDPEAFAPAEGDSKQLRRFKRRRRWSAAIVGRLPSYQAPVWQLQSYYFERAVDELLLTTVERMVSEGHQLAIHLGKMLCSSRTNFTMLAQQTDGEELSEERLAGLRASAMEPFERLVGRVRERLAEHRANLGESAVVLLEAYGADLARVDAVRFARRERRLAKDLSERREPLNYLPRAFAKRQSRLYERATLGLKITAFQHRVMAVCQRQKETTGLQLRNGALRTCEELVLGLKQLATALESGQREGLLVPKMPGEGEERFEPKEAATLLSQELEPALADLPDSVETISDASIDQLEEGLDIGGELEEVPIQSLAQFLLESALIAGVYEEAERAPVLETRALTVARDVARLVSFQLADIEGLEFSDSDALREQMLPAIGNALERLETEVSVLRELGERVAQKFDSQLEAVITGTNAYELTRAGSALKQHRRLHQGKLAVTGIRGAVRGGVTRLRQALVGLLYRGSSGVVLARQLRSNTRSATVVERLRRLVAGNSPRPAVLSDLPFFYRQLFFGQAVNDSLWVGREEHLARAKQAIGSHREGTPGVLVVVGDRGAGKSALCQRIVAKALDKRPAYWVRPPSGGTVKISAFHAALQRALERRGSYEELFEALPEHSALVFDDLELWWERSPEGFAVLDEILELASRFGQRQLFVFSMNTQAFQFLSRFRPLSENALSVLECGPMDAKELGAIVTLRHGSTGIKFELGGRAEDELTQWQIARLFSQHFRYCRGMVGSALRSWITHVERFRDGVITMRSPGREHGEDLDELRAEWSALLLELLLHRRLTLPRLERITSLDRERLRTDVDALVRMGLVVQSPQRAVELNPFVHHLVLARFGERGMVQG
ncbi:MAG: AAA family ATPase [Myxococcales bacterium]|nr:AAA family ATPase [Myxococcales bacterium]